MQTFNNGDPTGHGKMRAGVIRDLFDGFDTLADSASVAWDCDNRKLPQAKLTSTQSFTINMTNVLSGALGTLKIITSTASAITITLDTDYTNKTQGVLGEETITTIVMPAATGKQYILNFLLDGTTMHWFIEAAIPQWTDYTPTIVGFSSTPSFVCRYIYDPVRKLLHFYYQGTAATSNSASFTITLPFNAANVQLFVIQSTNNGTPAIGLAQTRQASNIVDIYNSAAFGGYATSGSKNLRATLSGIEIA